MASLPRDTIELLVNVYYGHASTADMAYWAAAALEGGADSPSLRMLASCHADEYSSDAIEYLERSFRELGIQRLTGEGLLRAYHLDVVQRFLDGEYTARAAVDLIYRRVIVPLGYPTDLAKWHAFDEGYDSDDPSVFYEEMPDEDFERVVKAEARRLLDESEL